MWYLFHLTPIENEENVVVLFLVTVRDISELKEPISENGMSSFSSCVYVCTCVLIFSLSRQI